ncbi:universal stress protein [Streptomyces sp. ICBB 8177]|uniref:universal stress protein n=1 Tax=Streptomyces sp. ICBB 8177 TaxID=563922 RepID=UPI000D67C3A1|nr:universal stress protein [Streptomyces sp. ICBB 8177]PWI44738.1 universal stress protein UspA [Streptomyces sp. ICBB 8177]
MVAGEQTPEVVVGVDGSAEAVTALDWAAAEAERRAAPLRIVYATVAGAKGDRAAAQDDARVPTLQAMRAVPAEATERVAAAYSKVEVRTTVYSEDAATALLRAARAADLLVIGARRHGKHVPPFPEPLCSKLGAHVGCPLVVVCDSTPHGSPRVAVGLRDERDAAAVRFAADSAARRGGTVSVLHAWEPWTNSARMAPQVGSMHEIRDEQERLLQRTLETAEANASGAPVERCLVSGRAHTVLAEASRSADLLVLGVHRAHGRLGRRTGGTVHSLLVHSACPVALVPLSSQRRGASSQDALAR